MNQYIHTYESAIADFSEAIRLNPEDATAYVGRAYTLAKIGKHEAAALDRAEAIRLKVLNRAEQCEAQ